MPQDDFAPPTGGFQAATAGVLPVYLKPTYKIREPGLLNGNISRNECRSLGQAYQFHGMNPTFRDIRRAKRYSRNKFHIVHPGKLSGAHYDAVARAIAVYSCEMINAAHDPV